MKGGRAIDLQQLMANPQLQRAFTERFTPLPPSMDVDGMAMVFTEAMLSTAANFAPGAKRSQEPAGWCASEETKTEMLAAWQERGAARELLSADPSNGNLRKPVKAAGKRLKRVRIEAVQRFLMEFDSQLGVRSKDRWRPIWCLQAPQWDGFRGEEIVQLPLHQGHREPFAP